MLGKRIKTLRTYLKLNKKAFADKMGMSSRSVYQWENDKVKLQAASLNLIEMTFNVNPEWLRNGNGNMFLADNKTENVTVDKIIKWINGLSDAEKAWISIEMQNRFPEYKEWLRK